MKYSPSSHCIPIVIQYGEQLTDSLRKQARAHQWKQALSALLWLLHDHPRGLFHHPWREASRVARCNKPETYDAVGR
jgi:hypothetical protein